MGPLSIDDPVFVHTISQWMSVSGELFVELYYPHSGTSGDFYLLTSMMDFNTMLSESRSGAAFFIMRDKQYPIRGTVDDDLVDEALLEVPDGERYEIVRPRFYPSSLSFLGDGDNHEHFKRDLNKLRGEEVFTGKAPNLPGSYWKPNDDEDVIIARK